MTRYKSDLRETNPKLHILYTGWAVQHLVAVNKAISQLSGFSNLNMDPFIGVLYEQKEKLILENAAYQAAYNILWSIGLETTFDGVSPLEDQDYSTIYAKLKQPSQEMDQEMDRAIEEKLKEQSVSDTNLDCDCCRCGL